MLNRCKTVFESLGPGAKAIHGHADYKSWCYRTFFGGNLDFSKIKKLKKFVLMPKPALKCENNWAILKQNCAQNRFCL